MRAAALYRDIMADDDAIKPRHGAVAVETGRCFDQPVVVECELRKRAAIRPLVEIPHQHGGQMVKRAVEPGQQRADLPPPPEPRKVKMRTDDAQRMAVDDQIGEHGATWF